MQHSNVKNLNIENFANGIVQRRTNKTTTTIVIPPHWIVQEISIRNDNKIPEIPSQQSYNKTIKIICRKAGIMEKVLIERTKGFRLERKLVAKYSLIPTHTMRRSFATNAYQAGIPTFRIIVMTGLKTESAFFKHIRINKKENAELLSKHSFFNKN
ncbi:MAG TPA: hypothetical protein DCQ50_00730 [Chryseobacterium sp.]|nr:hypothetical protein [Chryseobacterium sp.]